MGDKNMPVRKLIIECSAVGIAIFALWLIEPRGNLVEVCSGIVLIAFATRLSAAHGF